MDRAKLMAYLLEKSERCAMCGTSDWEWDPEQGGSRDAYVGAVRHCWGCYHLKIANEGEDLPPGSSTTLKPKAKRRKIKVALPA